MNLDAIYLSYEFPVSDKHLYFHHFGIENNSNFLFHFRMQLFLLFGIFCGDQGTDLVRKWQVIR